uniref:Uncharacterized protein n=1 Tax=Leersia perrieri TaxID=77586 RepID=A0A0D9W690_9ORYZ
MHSMPLAVPSRVPTQGYLPQFAPRRGETYKPSNAGVPDPPRTQPSLQIGRRLTTSSEQQPRLHLVT